MLLIRNTECISSVFNNRLKILPQCYTCHSKLDIDFYPFLDDRFFSLLWFPLSRPHFVTSSLLVWMVMRLLHGFLLFISQELTQNFKWASAQVSSSCLLTICHSLAFHLPAFCFQRWSCSCTSCTCQSPTPPSSSLTQGYASTESSFESGTCLLNSLEITEFLSYNIIHQQHRE